MELKREYKNNAKTTIKRQVAEHLELVLFYSL